MHLLTAVAARSVVVLADGAALLEAPEFRRGVAGLAARLAERGLHRGDRVALSGPRGAESLMALYACWHGGFVAVPLEAGLPPARIAAVLAEARPAAAVAVGRRATQLLRVAGDLKVFVSTHPEPGDDAFADALATTPRAVAPRGDDELASLHFTSGSTGGAKGVPYTRGGVDVFARWWAETLGIGPEDRALWAFPMAYAPSLIPLGAALSAGAPVIPLPAAAAAVGDRARAALADATLLLAVPSLVASLLGRGDLAGGRLRAVVMAGEPVPTALVRALREAAPGLRVFNLYGTTECNGIAVHEADGEESGPILPAGHPLPFMSVRIVDEAGAACADGEVVVAGPTVMDEYWGAVHRASWFELDGRRHYRTGDRGRWDAAGRLVLLGRADRQVKLGGHRVELGPVEAACAAVPGVREAAVVPDGRGGLVGFLVGEASVEDVSRALSRALPAYAIPARFESLEALPRGARGKVDLTALRGRASS